MNIELQNNDIILYHMENNEKQNNDINIELENNDMTIELQNNDMIEKKTLLN